MRVLSLFDGISCGRVALEKAGIPVSAYIASEVDKHAMKVSADNWSDIIQIGDVRNVAALVESGALGVFDMVIGGSPCQSLSFAGKQAGLSTKEGIEITTLEQYKQLRDSGFEFEGQSYLFWEYVLVLDAVRRQNPDVKFLLENVRMTKKWLEVFNRVMGVDGVLINSALVCAQNRQRYYWCNWQVEQPEDRGILLRDIIEHGEVDRDKSYCIDANYYKGGSLKNYLEKSRRQVVLSQSEARLMVAEKTDKRQLLGITETPNGYRPYKNDGRKGSFSEIGTIATPDHKAQCMTVAHVPKITGCRMVGRKINPETGSRDDYNPNLTAEQRVEPRTDGKAGCITTVQKDSMVYAAEAQEITYRKLTVTECCRLQGLPDNYCKAVSNSQAYKALGNGWQVDTIEHLFRELLRTDMKFFQLWLSKVVA